MVALKLRPFMIALLLLLSCQALFATEQAYQEGQYTQALEGFLSQVGAPNIAQGPLYYNIGNTYYKQEIYPKAYWAYKKATRDLPRDEDLYHNLLLTEKKLGFNATEDSGIVLFVKRFPFFSLSEFTTMLGFSIGLFSLFLWIGILKRVYKIPLILTGICILLSGFGSSIRYYQTQIKKTGVIISAKAPLKAGPVKTLPTLTHLSGGTEVIRIRQQNEWVEIRLDGGLVGWILESDYWAL
jgi:tetratricopeptide (TPR) repeat protein